MRVGIASMMILIVSIAVVAGVLYGQWGNLHNGRPVRAFRGRRAPDEIGIVDQTLIGIQNSGLRLRARHREMLDHYAWIDREHGVARIPIRAAIDIVAARLGQEQHTAEPHGNAGSGNRR